MLLINTKVESGIVKSKCMLECLLTSHNILFLSVKLEECCSSPSEILHQSLQRSQKLEIFSKIPLAFFRICEASVQRTVCVYFMSGR